MELLVRRLVFEKTYTEGQLFIDGAYFCDTLEDRTRDFNKDGDLDEPGEEKVFGETAIPFGTYDVRMSFSNRFQKIMPEIIHVKDFDGIRIHAGVTPQHTHGCLLTGRFDKPGRLRNSKEVTAELYKIIDLAIQNKEKVKITIS